MSTTRPTVASRAKSHLIGGRYKKNGLDIQIADSIKAGQLSISKHDDWGLPVNPKWDEDPFDDRNWKFLYHSLRWADTLRRAYIKTKDRDYAFAHQHYIRSWLNANQKGKNSSDFAWHDMAAAHRTGIISASIATFGAQGWLMTALREHGEVLSNPHFGPRVGNHALHVKVGLLIAGDVTGNRSWVDTAVGRIEELLLESVDEEGVDREGAMSYQWNNYTWFKEAADHIVASGRPLPSSFARLSLMPSFIGYATPPTKFPVRFGDSDLGKPLRDLADPTVQYVRSDGELGVKPLHKYRNFKSGYVFSRSSWELPADRSDIFCSIRYGASYNDTPHGHFDGGSITLTVGDRTILDENGRYKYQKDTFTEFLASNRAHNSVSFASNSYDKTAPTDLISSSSNPGMDSTILRRIENGSAQWTRSVYLLRDVNLLVVMDDLMSAEKDAMSIYWQLGSGALVSSSGENSKKISYLDSDVSVEIQTFSNENLFTKEISGQTEPVLGWRSFKYGTVEPSVCLESTAQSDSLRVATVFRPVQSADLASVVGTIDEDIFSVEYIDGHLKRSFELNFSRFA